MKTILAAIVSVSLLSPTPAGVPSGDGRSARELIDAAQQAMTAERFQDALDLYRQAGALLPDAAEIPYNMGVAAYRAGELERALALFDKARTLAADPAMQARSAYNLGTSSAQQAVWSRTADPAIAQAQMADATESLKTALDRFRDAIAMNPDDEDARANGELAWRWLKQLEQLQDQMQQQGDQQDQDGQQQDQAQDDPEQQDQPQGQPQGQEQDQERQQRGDDRQEEQDQEQEQPLASDEQQQEPQESPDQATPDERPMSREEAERLLQRVRDKEARRREELARQAARGHRPVDKDW